MMKEYMLERPVQAAEGCSPDRRNQNEGKETEGIRSVWFVCHAKHDRENLLERRRRRVGVVVVIVGEE